MQRPQVGPQTVGALTLAAICIFYTAMPPASSGQTATSKVAFDVDSAQSKVLWSLESTLHTVHGTFSIKSGTIHFDSQSKTGAADGEIVVSAASGESGNGSRDGRMHKEILETAKYPDAVLHVKQIEGKVAISGTSDVNLRGTLSLHGSDHEISSPVHIEVSGARWNGTSHFEIPYVQWGIKDPSNFLLRVKPVVNVEVQMSGTIELH